MQLKLRLNKLPLFLLATIFSSLLFALIIIAAPQTEKLINTSSFNLNLNDTNYWKKEITLKLTIKNQDLPLKDQKIAETEKILYKRLNDFQVQEVTITRANGEKETEPLLKVTVQSSKRVEDVLPLIQQRYFMRIVTRKDGVDFDNENDQFAIFNPTNYIETPFTRRFFRNIYLTKLRNTAGEESYFAIFKTNPLTANQFNNFIMSNAGQAAGLRIDGFVTPITIPVPTQSQQGVITKPVFSVGLNIADDQYEVNNILLNSGVIPIEYVVDSTKDLTPQVYQINYIQLTLVIAGLIIASSIYFLIKKESVQIIEVLFPYGILISGWLTYLKLTQTGIDIFLLLFEAVLIYLFSISLLNQKQSKLLSAVICIIFFILLHFLGIGYVRVFALHMVYLLIGLFVSTWIAKLYVNLIKKTLSR